MKKGLFLLISLLLLSGCGNNIEEKQKECIDYRNDYLQYIKEKYKIVDKRDGYSDSYITLDDGFTMFYSEVEDKCIAAFSYTEYTNDETLYEGGYWLKMYYINDVFNDDTLWSEREAKDEGGKEKKATRSHFYRQKDYYRTGKDPYQFY